MNANLGFLRHLFAGNLAIGLVLLNLAVFPTEAIAQRITSPSPRINAEDVDPSSAISATFKSEAGVTVQPETVKVFVDNVEVTNRSVITSDFFSYRADEVLAPGEHNVRLEFTNSAGQERQAQWTFTVGAVFTAEIDSVSHNASNAP